MIDDDFQGFEYNVLRRFHFELLDILLIKDYIEFLDNFFEEGLDEGYHFFIGMDLDADDVLAPG
jgi:hypothetical protein